MEGITRKKALKCIEVPSGLSIISCNSVYQTLWTIWEIDKKREWFNSSRTFHKSKSNHLPGLQEQLMPVVCAELRGWRVPRSQHGSSCPVILGRDCDSFLHCIVHQTRTWTDRVYSLRPKPDATSLAFISALSSRCSLRLWKMRWPEWVRHTSHLLAVSYQFLNN